MERQDASEAESQLLAELPSERYIRELLMLYEIGQSLCSIHDLDLLLRFAMERVVTLLSRLQKILSPLSLTNKYAGLRQYRWAGHPLFFRSGPISLWILAFLSSGFRYYALRSPQSAKAMIARDCVFIDNFE